MRLFLSLMLFLSGCQFDDGRLSERCDEMTPCPSGTQCEQGLCRTVVPLPPSNDGAVDAAVLDGALMGDAEPPRPVPPDRGPPPGPPDFGLPDAKVQPPDAALPPDAMPPEDAEPPPPPDAELPPEELVRDPTDDTFVSSIFENQPVGARENTLFVRAGVGGRTEAFFRFPLDFAPPQGARIRARLSIKVRQSPVNLQEEARLRLSQVESDWSEDTLTWQIRPSVIRTYADDTDQRPESGQWARWEVGPEVADGLRMGATHIAFGLRAPSGEEGLSQWTLYSKETPRAEDRPLLELSW
ncbi:MAG: DNRLRE domain-containing protein [Bradymonadia bacterium]